MTTPPIVYANWIVKKKMMVSNTIASRARRTVIFFNDTMYNTTGVPQPLCEGGRTEGLDQDEPAVADRVEQLQGRDAGLAVVRGEDELGGAAGLVDAGDAHVAAAQGPHGHALREHSGAVRVEGSAVQVPLDGVLVQGRVDAGRQVSGRAGDEETRAVAGRVARAGVAVADCAERDDVVLHPHDLRRQPLHGARDLDVGVDVDVGGGERQRVGRRVDGSDGVGGDRAGRGDRASRQAGHAGRARNRQVVRDCDGAAGQSRVGDVDRGRRHGDRGGRSVSGLSRRVGDTDGTVDGGRGVEVDRRYGGSSGGDRKDRGRCPRRHRWVLTSALTIKVVVRI